MKYVTRADCQNRHQSEFLRSSLENYPELWKMTQSHILNRANHSEISGKVRTDFLNKVCVPLRPESHFGARGKEANQQMNLKYQSGWVAQDVLCLQAHKSLQFLAGFTAQECVSQRTFKMKGNICWSCRVGHHWFVWKVARSEGMFC